MYYGYSTHVTQCTGDVSACYIFSMEIWNVKHRKGYTTLLKVDNKCMELYFHPTSRRRATTILPQLPCLRGTQFLGAAIPS